MYHVEHLLSLLATEKAKELQFRAGRPPVILLDDVQHSLQGPPMTEEDVVRLLRGLANSRQMRDLRERGAVRFIYTAQGRSPFLVHAKMENESIVFDIS